MIRSASLVVLAASALFVSAASAQYYAFQTLGTLGGPGSFATGVNDAGQVVGWSIDGSGRERAFLWDEVGGMRDLGTLGGAHSRAAAINDSGQVVGRSLNASGQTIAFIWDQAGGMRALGHLGTPRSEARDINNAGTVVGSSFLADGRERGFIWTAAGGMTAITPPYEPGESSGYGINDAGTTCGLASVAQGDRRAYLRSSTGTISTGANGLATEVNAAGHASVNSLPPLFWPAPANAQRLDATPLTVPTRLTLLNAWAINNTGAVVGDGELWSGGERRAMRWDGRTGWFDLTDALEYDSGWVLREARDISQSGRIVGYATDPDGRTRAFLLAPRPVAPVLHVRAEAPPGGDGLTWATAYRHPADGLIAAMASGGSVEEIWVARGVYKPRQNTFSQSYRRDASFPLVRGTALYGGFRGDETTRAQRDPRANPTILSGDHAGDDGAGFTNREDNSFQVVCAIGSPDRVLETRILDGFTARGGHAEGNGVTRNRGGGLFCEGAHVRVENCTFTDNLASRAGGAWVTFGTATFRGCTFLANSAYDDSAGLFIEAVGSVLQCEFRGNIFPEFADSGGIAMHLKREVNAIGCVVVANTCLSSQWCPAVFVDTGCRLINSRVIGNSTPRNSVGGVALGGSAEMINCVVAGNSGPDGGVLSYGSGGVGPFIINCAIAFNAGSGATGGLTLNGTGTQIANSIIWGNTSSAPQPQARQVTGAGGAFAYSRVEGWTGSLGGQGNSGADPLFVDPLGPDGIPGTEDDDLHLRRPSTSIDGGRNASVRPDATDLDGDLNTVEPTPIDLDGLPRFRCDVNTQGTGQGTSPLVDIGPYEFQPAPCPGNFNGDCRLDIFDFLAFQNAWTLQDPRADVEPDGVFDVFDFLAFQNAFAAGCP